MLSDERLKQVLNAVCNHPSAGVLLLRGEVAPVEPSGKYLLGRHASLIEGHPTIGSDSIFAQARPGSGCSIQYDKDFAPLRRSLDAEASTPPRAIASPR